MTTRGDIANESNRKLYQNHLASMTKLREARLRIAALEKAICDYADAVVLMEGVTFEEYIADADSRKIIADVLNARLAKEVPPWANL